MKPIGWAPHVPAIKIHKDDHRAEIPNNNDWIILQYCFENRVQSIGQHELNGLCSYLGINNAQVNTIYTR